MRRDRGEQPYGNDDVSHSLTRGHAIQAGLSENSGVRRKSWCLIFGSTATLCLALAFMRNGPRPVDLSRLRALHPKLKTEGQYPGVTTYVFRQPVEEIKRELDRQLSLSTGWDSSGYPPAGFYWYRPQGWEGTVPRLLSDVGLGKAEINLESTSEGTELTLFHGREVTGL